MTRGPAAEAIEENAMLHLQVYSQAHLTAIPKLMLADLSVRLS